MSCYRGPAEPVIRRSYVTSIQAPRQGSNTAGSGQSTLINGWGAFGDFPAQRPQPGPYLIPDAGLLSGPLIGRKAVQNRQA